MFHKMCPHAINGAGCTRIESCPDDHPLDCETARAAYNAMGAKKSLRICAGFLSGGCLRPDCTYLHAAIVLKAAAPAREPAATRGPPRDPASARTPPAAAKGAPAAAAKSERAPAAAKSERQPAAATKGPAAPAKGGRASADPSASAKGGARPPAGRSAASGSSAKGRGASSPRRAAAPHDEACLALRRIQGKLRALDKARSAFEDLGVAVGSASAREDARRAAEMQKEALRLLAAFSEMLDQQLADLGAQPEADAEADADADAAETGHADANHQHPF